MPTTTQHSPGSGCRRSHTCPRGTQTPPVCVPGRWAVTAAPGGGSRCPTCAGNWGLRDHSGQLSSRRHSASQPAHSHLCPLRKGPAPAGREGWSPPPRRIVWETGRCVADGEGAGAWGGGAAAAVCELQGTAHAPLCLVLCRARAWSSLVPTQRVHVFVGARLPGACPGRAQLAVHAGPGAVCCCPDERGAGV